tara:strand:+ start:630 stop:911 length:282 start_codon:yes stop_codon:yes gene_type:complete
MKNTQTELEYLTSPVGYGMLRAIVKFYPTEDTIKERANFYLDKDVSLDKKLLYKRGEGSFFQYVLEGDVVGATRVGSKDLTVAICNGLIHKEI